MKLRAVAVLQELSDQHVVPEAALGARIKDKAGLIAGLAAHARLLQVVLLGAYALQIGLVVLVIVLAVKPAVHGAKEVLPYLSGAVLLGLLEFSRRITREWLTMTLALKVAPHASNDQLIDLISNLLLAFKPGAEKPK
jgi:hypothetical protein